MDPYVKVCFECFSADWTLVKHNYYQYERYEITLPELELPIYEGDATANARTPKPKLQRDLGAGAVYRKRGGLYMAPPLKEVLGHYIFFPIFFINHENNKKLSIF